MPSQREEQHREAVKMVLLGTTYVLQWRNKKTGQWVTLVRNIQGKARAYEALNKHKARDRYGYQWRAIQKNEAQKYTEGWEACRRFLSGEFQPEDEGPSNNEDEERPEAA